MSGQLKMPGNLAAMFDWRKAAAQGQKSKVDATAVNATAKPATEPAASTPAAAPPSKLQNAQHFVAIQEALGPEDAAFARAAAGNLTPAQIDAWLGELGQLTVDDAVTRIRAEIAKAKGDAS